MILLFYYIILIYFCFYFLKALLAPGCLEICLHVDLPDFQSRHAIWQGLLGGVPQENVNFSVLAEHSSGYSGAEVCPL